MLNFINDWRKLPDSIMWTTWMFQIRFVQKGTWSSRLSTSSLHWRALPFEPLHTYAILDLLGTDSDPHWAGLLRHSTNCLLHVWSDDYSTTYYVGFCNNFEQSEQGYDDIPVKHSWRLTTVAWQVTTSGWEMTINAGCLSLCRDAV